MLQEPFRDLDQFLLYPITPLTLEALDGVWIHNISKAMFNVEQLRSVFASVANIYPAERHGKVAIFLSEMRDTFKDYSLARLIDETLNEDCETLNCDALYDVLYKCLTDDTRGLMLKCNFRLTNVLVLLRAWSDAHPTCIEPPVYFCEDANF